MSKAYVDKFHIEGGEIIRQIVFGANDGIVSIFALLAGVAGAEQDAQTILITLLAATIAGAISMMMGEFISGKSERNYFENEIRQERLEVRLIPEIEREEVALIFRKKGFEGKILEEIVNRITADEDKWVLEMVRDEIGVAELEQEGELKGTIVIFISFIFGAMFPTGPYMVLQFLPDNVIFLAATFFTFFGLFLVGALKKYVTGANWIKSGVEMLLVGGSAFGISYIIGNFLGIAV